MSLLLGVDVGTASVKGVLATDDGEVLASANRQHGLSLPRPGWAEHDAEAVWWGGFTAVVRELLAHPGASAPAALGVSGIGPCVLPCDARLRPLRPAILYGIDTRAAREIDECVARYGAAELLRRGGSPITSQAVGPKLMWLRSHEPEVWRQTAGWYMASSFIVARLTGEYVLDHHSASQSDPLYDIERHEWAEDLLEDLAPGVPAPRLVDPDEVVGVVGDDAARATSLPRGTPVVAGTIDACAEALSVGVRSPGDLMLMYGSTIFMIQITASARPSEGVWTTIAGAPPTRALAAGMATSGSLTAWLRDLTGVDGFEALAREASAVPAGARGVLVLPYFAGERSPLFDPDLRGVIAGLTLAHGLPELARAVYEAIGFGIRHNLEVLAAAGGEARRVVAVGGGTATPRWPAIVSSVTGVEQQLPAQRIGACYGDALLAARGAGLVSAESDWARDFEVVAPDAADARVYDELYPLYRRLARDSAEVCHRLAEHGRRAGGGDGA